MNKKFTPCIKAFFYKASKRLTRRIEIPCRTVHSLEYPLRGFKQSRYLHIQVTYLSVPFQPLFSGESLTSFLKYFVAFPPLFFCYFLFFESCLSCQEYSLEKIYSIEKIFCLFTIALFYSQYWHFLQRMTTFLKVSCSL